MDAPVTRAPRFDVPLMWAPAQAVAEAGLVRPWGVSQNVSASGTLINTEVRPELGSRQSVAFVWDDDWYTCDVQVTRHCPAGVAVSYIEPDPWFLWAVGQATGLDPSLS